MEQYWKQQRFVSEPFWAISVSIRKDDLLAAFSWKRGVLFDRMCCLLVYEQLLAEPIAEVKSVESNPTRKWYVLIGECTYQEIGVHFR